MTLLMGALDVVERSAALTPPLVADDSKGSLAIGRRASSRPEVDEADDDEDGC